MSISFTARQGQFLAFIQGYAEKRGYAPSFDEIGAHFGITPPSVNSMIKTLERRGCLSRLPGVARSLRVLIPAAALPGSEYGGEREKGPPRESPLAAPSDSGDVAGTVAIAVLEAVMPLVVAQETSEGVEAVRRAAQAVYEALLGRGFEKNAATAVARRVASEAARWNSTGRGTVIPNRQRVRRGAARLRAAATPKTKR